MKSWGHTARGSIRAAGMRYVTGCVLKSRSGMLSDSIRSLGLVRVHVRLSAPLGLAFSILGPETERV